MAQARAVSGAAPRGTTEQCAKLGSAMGSGGRARRGRLVVGRLELDRIARRVRPLAVGRVGAAGRIRLRPFARPPRPHHPGPDVACLDGSRPTRADAAARRRESTAADGRAHNCHYSLHTPSSLSPFAHPPTHPHPPPRSAPPTPTCSASKSGQGATSRQKTRYCVCARVRVLEWLPPRVCVKGNIDV